MLSRSITYASHGVRDWDNGRHATESDTLARKSVALMPTFMLFIKETIISTDEKQFRWFPINICRHSINQSRLQLYDLTHVVR